MSAASSIAFEETTGPSRVIKSGHGDTVSIKFEETGRATINNDHITTPPSDIIFESVNGTPKTTNIVTKAVNGGAADAAGIKYQIMDGSTNNNGAAREGPRTPAKLSKRAELYIRTPRTPRTAAPETPRTRSPLVNKKVQSAAPAPAAAPKYPIESDTESLKVEIIEDEPARANAGMPPLAPPESRPPGAAPPTSNAARQPRDKSIDANSDFSSVMGDASFGDAKGASATAGGAATAISNTTVTSHTRRLTGHEWPAVLQYSHDNVERSLLHDVANATGLERQFIVLASVSADAETGNLEARFNIAHPLEKTEAKINEQLANNDFENTMMLHDMRVNCLTEAAHPPAASAVAPTAATTTAITSALAYVDSDDSDVEARQHQPPTAHAKHPSQESESRNRHPAEAPKEKENDQQEQAPVFSFVRRVGDGLLLIDYMEEGVHRDKQLELFFDGKPEDMRCRFIKLYISEYMKVSLPRISVRCDGADLADDVSGNELGWINGSVVDVYCRAMTANEKEAVLAARSQPYSTCTSPDQAHHRKKGKGVNLHKKTTSSKKKATSHKKAANASKNHKSSAPRKRKNRMRSRGSSPASYMGDTFSSPSRYAPERPLPKELTTPRVYQPRTPRPGAERSMSVAMQYGESTAPSRSVRGGSVVTSMAGGAYSIGYPHSQTPAMQQQQQQRTGLATPRSRHASSSRPRSICPSISHGPNFTDADDNEVPLQYVMRGVTPTTPRSGSRPVIRAVPVQTYQNSLAVQQQQAQRHQAPLPPHCSVGSHDGAEKPRETPSVSRRSHSPLRAHPTTIATPLGAAAPLYGGDNEDIVFEVVEEEEAPEADADVPAPYEERHEYEEEENIHGSDSEDADAEEREEDAPAAPPLLEPAAAVAAGATVEEEEYNEEQELADPEPTPEEEEPIPF